MKTKRWNDTAEPDDGYRVLVCRYRPRGVPKEAETWDAWSPQLGPSRELHADCYGKHGPPIGWAEFRRRYVAEMKEQRETLAALADRGRGRGDDHAALLVGLHGTPSGVIGPCFAEARPRAAGA